VKQFLAIYTGTPASIAKWNTMPEHELKQRQAEGVKAWYAWVEKYKASIVAMGGPLGRTKSISPKGVTDIRNNMTAYTVVQADTHEAAAKLFENHPHFTIFPGDAVELMECMPVPTM
jgi:hypothetical protein